MKTEALKRFVKDQKIPINVLSEPYFSYFLKLYEPHFGTQTAYKKFKRAVDMAGGEDKFLDAYYETRDRVIQAIKETDAYTNFMEADMKKYAVTGLDFKNVKKTDVYSSDNDGKYFVSVDICKANFQVMKLFDKSLVGNCDEYDDFIRQFTDSDYIRESKYTRQVIFGNMNPKRQITMERYYMANVLKFLLDEGLFDSKDVRVFNNDEIVFEFDGLMSEAAATGIAQAIKEELDLDVHVSPFLLRFLGDDCFVKEYGDKTFTFKNVPSTIFAQVYKNYLGLPIHAWDKVFVYEGKLAQFI